jgi:hypothetical protein
MAFYKPIGKKHLEYLKNLNLPADDNMKQLSFQIVESSLDIDFDSMMIESDGSHMKNIRYNEGIRK